MQASVTILLLPFTLFLLSLLPVTRKAASTRLAAVKSAILKKLPATLSLRPEVFVTDRFAAHRLLVRATSNAGGGAFSDRPPSIVPSAMLSRRRHYNITDGELVGLCSEFLGAGTEPAASALQWIMANLVKQPDVQRALRKEIDAAEEVGEEVVGTLEYLNAVIMEGLRLHPTVPMVLRQVTAEDHVVLDGRRLPAGTEVHFMLARLARDKTVWGADPHEFRPERFMADGEGEGMSLVAGAGSAGEIRTMMPFGSGRIIPVGKKLDPYPRARE